MDGYAHEIEKCSTDRYSGPLTYNIITLCFYRNGKKHGRCKVIREFRTMDNLLYKEETITYTEFDNDEMAITFIDKNGYVIRSNNNNKYEYKYDGQELVKYADDATLSLLVNDQTSQLIKCIGFDVANVFMRKYHRDVNASGVVCLNKMTYKLDGNLDGKFPTTAIYFEYKIYTYYTNGLCYFDKNLLFPRRKDARKTKIPMNGRSTWHNVYDDVTYSIESTFVNGRMNGFTHKIDNYLTQRVYASTGSSAMHIVHKEGYYRNGKKYGRHKNIFEYRTMDGSLYEKSSIMYEEFINGQLCVHIDSDGYVIQSNGVGIYEIVFNRIELIKYANNTILSCEVNSDDVYVSQLIKNKNSNDVEDVHNYRYYRRIDINGVILFKGIIYYLIGNVSTT